MSRIRLTVAALMLSAAALGSLSACSSAPAASTDNSPTVSDSTAPLGTYDNPDLTPTAPRYHYAYEQLMPNGQKLQCVYASNGDGDGFTCNWDAFNAAAE